MLENVETTESIWRVGVISLAECRETCTRKLCWVMHSSAFDAITASATVGVCILAGGCCSKSVQPISMSMSSHSVWISHACEYVSALGSSTRNAMIISGQLTARTGRHRFARSLEMQHSNPTLWSRACVKDTQLVGLVKLADCTAIAAIAAKTYDGGGGR